jgi:hypothetical protein
MKRAHSQSDVAATNRNHKQRKFCMSQFAVPNAFTTQRGRYRKRDGFDCGNTQCMICHSEKILDIKSRKERIADQRFSEQLNDD